MKLGEFDLSDGEVDDEVDAAVDGQAEVAHPKQPAEECEIFDQNCPSNRNWAEPPPRWENFKALPTKQQIGKLEYSKSGLFMCIVHWNACAVGRGPKVKISRINKILRIQLGLYIRKPGKKSLTQKKLILIRGIAFEKNGPCSWENEVKISKKMGLF